MRKSETSEPIATMPGVRKNVEPEGPDVGDALYRTRAQETYVRLRDDILTCRLEPGMKLRSNVIRQSYDIGTSPLREALMRLVSDGLVLLEEQRGFRVAEISEKELIDITRTRAELECAAIRLSIELGDERWESEVVGAFYRLEKKGRASLTEVDAEWETRHRAFHFATVSACGAQWLLHFRDLLYDHAERYRRLSVRRPTGPRDDLSEHRAIYEAVLARDAERAQASVREHLWKTAEIVLGSSKDLFLRT